MADLLVVRSKAKEFAKKKKMMMGDEAIKELSKAVEALVSKAAERAKANGRATIKGRDI